MEATTTRSNDRPAQPHVFGTSIVARETVPTDEWAYLLDEAGQETCYIGRVRGRKVGEIAADLKKALGKLNYEWATLGQTYKYSAPGSDDTQSTECPRFHHLAVYATHGGSEGHLVHVDMMVDPEDKRSGHHVAKKLFMVKTFGGAKYTKKIVARLEKVLGAL